MTENAPQNFPNRSRISRACPTPVTAPSRSDISWFTYSTGTSSSSVHSSRVPWSCPAWAYVPNAPASLSPAMTIRPGPTTASSVLNFADGPRRGAVSPASMVPSAPRMAAVRGGAGAVVRSVMTGLPCPFLPGAGAVSRIPNPAERLECRHIVAHRRKYLTES